MRIPEVQKELIELAAKHNLPRLAVLADELYRKPPTMRSKPRSERMTPEIARWIVYAHKRNPELPQHVLAARFGVSQGRVSEVLSGKRT